MLPILEVMSDNLLFHRGGPALLRTQRLAEQTPVLLHGVGLNIASADPLDLPYLNELALLRQTLGARIVSDHLSFSRSGGYSSYELLPIVRNKRYLEHVSARVQRVQETLQCQLVLENVSAYVEHSHCEMSEGDFFSELTEKTGCGILLDVNNLYVNSVNFGFDLYRELDRFPLNAVQQLHVAGHSLCDDFLFDTHDQPASAAVIALLDRVIHRLPNARPIVVEWDDPKADLRAPLEEIQRLEAILESQIEKEVIHA